jgi:hypothetical protein
MDTHIAQHGPGGEQAQVPPYVFWRKNQLSGKA